MAVRLARGIWTREGIGRGSMRAPPSYALNSQTSAEPAGTESFGPLRRGDARLRATARLRWPPSHVCSARAACMKTTRTESCLEITL